MKKALKIAGITLGSIIGVVLLVVGVAIWMVFTPERLTPVVRDIAKEYVTCEHQIGKVELTFFSTFPKFGLDIDSVVIISSIDGAQSDTLFAAPELVATIDVAELLDNKLHIYDLHIPNIVANVFINESGVSNFDIFNLPPDTTTTEDTTAFILPFQEIKVDALHVSAQEVTFCNLRDSMDVAVAGLALDAKAKSINDIHLQVAVAAADATLGEVQYANQLHLAMNIPAIVDYEQMRVALNQALIAINQWEISLDGWVKAQEDIEMDMRAALHEWQIGEVLALLPPTLLSSLEGITADGIISLEAHAQGVYSEDKMPIVDAHLVLKDGKGKYSALPYSFHSLALDADMHLDMQDEQQTMVQIHDLRAHTSKSSLQGNGMVKDLLGNMWIDVQTNLDVNLADARYFLPEEMLAEGRIKGKLGIQIHMDDVLEMALERGTINGDLRLIGVRYDADGIYASLPDNRLKVQIPNPQPTRKEVGWLAGELSAKSGKVKIDSLLQTELGATKLSIEVSNILSDAPHLHASLALQSEEQIHVVMDSMDITMTQPTMTASATYNMQDSTEMPSADAAISFERLYGHYTDIQADVTGGKLTAALHAPRMKAGLEVESLKASMGEDYAIQTQHVAIEAAAKYNKDGGDNILLAWRPKLNVDMNQAEITIAGWEQKLLIPDMDFAYSNRDFHIERSKLILGNSDFELTGNVKHIGRWLREQGTLEGELNFTSNHTDANELLALLSADEGSEEETKGENIEAESEKQEESEPFLVPDNVDLVLNTQIKQADFFNQTATNLGGKIYIKDGTLILEEMGFICDAARLQLTAMYRTPRRNHIYVGFDYHMINVNIQELIGMIPQIDTMMPMLRSFKGEAEFHLAAETYTNAQYEIKPSTLRGAASIYGKDLVVMDSETFSKISKLLLFSKKTENKVDSISAEITLYKKEIDVYPFCVSMDNYMVALGGQHNLDMSFNYDVNVLSPIYLGVNVSGTLDDLDIKLARCKYAKDFKPIFHRKVDTQSAELRAMIRESMRRNVKL